MPLKGAALFCALLAAAVPSWSSPPKKGKPPKESAAESVRRSTASFAWTSTAPLTLESILAHFEDFDRGLETLSAGFEQTLTMKEPGWTSSVEGTVLSLKPDHLRIERMKPERQTVVIDGKDIWIHRHSQDQVIQTKLEDLKKADPMAGHMLQFGTYASMLRTYDVTVDTAPPRVVLLLRPKEKTAKFELRLELEPDTLFPARSELRLELLRIRTTLSDYVFNPVLDEKRFQFVPPPGADVIRDFKPPALSP
jgi:outer membrane lipoprotein carrier protein